MTETVYDLVVLGAGPGGYVAALHAAEQGFRVVVVDERRQPGGVCLHEGCIPSKALLDSSGLFNRCHHGLEDHGIGVAAPRLNLSQMMARKQQLVERLGGGVSFLFQSQKVEHRIGRGTLLPPTTAGHQLRVDSEQGSETLTAKRLLLATGSRPSPLPTLPVDGRRILNARHALCLTEVPSHLVVVGAGAIGLELGSVWRRLGAEVTVVEMLDQIVPRAEPALAAALQKLLEEQGLEFCLQNRIEALQQGEELTLELSSADGQSRRLVCDAVLVATGRQPNVEGIGLEQLGLVLNERGQLTVDDNFETSVAGIYAVGDLVAGPMLAHKASYEGQVLVERLMGHKTTIDYSLMPKVIYTHPELAVVGQTCDELTRQGIDHISQRLPWQANGRAHCYGETSGYVELVAEPRSGRLLGISILSPLAAELINQASTLIRFGGSVSDWTLCCPAHPTLGEAFKDTALALQRKLLRQ